MSAANNARAFWEAGLRVFGLNAFTGQGKDARCHCGNPKCGSPGKHPLISNWQHTPAWSEEQIDAMVASGQFDTGFGVLCNGLLVIDVDARNDGVESMQRLVQRVPETAGAGMIVETGSGGGSKHYYFLAPAGVTLVQRLADYPGLDFKSSGYVVGPGSMHASGNTYRLAYGSPDDIDEAPAALVELLRKPERQRADDGDHAGSTAWAETALREELATLLAAPEGQRNSALNTAAFNLGQIIAGGALAEGYVRQRLTAAAQGIGLDAGEVKATIDSGLKAGMAEPRGPKEGGRPVPRRLPAHPHNGRNPPPHLLHDDLPPAPSLPLHDVLHPALAEWVAITAESRGAPADYVVLSVLSVLSAAIGNTRWVSPWRGWSEPPTIWGMAVGLPSAGKSPAIDAVVRVVREVEKPIRQKAEKERKAWAERAAVAKIAERSWQAEVKAAVEAGDKPPAKPDAADAGPPPHIPRLVLNDATIERLGVILANQPRGTMQMRDELAGWLESMTRYAAGGTDRPFWLEAYGGRGYTVERMGREPLTIDRLTIAVLGGVQPDRLNSLLLKTDDDGLLARFVPVWPEPAPVKRPDSWADDTVITALLDRLLSLKMLDDGEDVRPLFVSFTEEARSLMDKFRLAVREWESETEGLMLSFVGKLPGLVARLSLVLACADWAIDGADSGGPAEIGANHFERAAHLVENYILPMARRAYAVASVPQDMRAARRLVAIIREHGWESFASRDVLRLERSGLDRAASLNPALAVLEDGDVVWPVDAPAGPKGGRPQRLFLVNPAIHGRRP